MGSRAYLQIKMMIKGWSKDVVLGFEKYQKLADTNKILERLCVKTIVEDSASWVTVERLLARAQAVWCSRVERTNGRFQRKPRSGVPADGHPILRNGRVLEVVRVWPWRLKMLVKVTAMTQRDGCCKETLRDPNGSQKCHLTLLMSHGACAQLMWTGKMALPSMIQ